MNVPSDVLKVLIVDDEPLARRRLRRILEEIEGVDLVGSIGDGMALPETIRALQPDVLLLDIRMPGKDGIQLAKELQGDIPQIIYVTAYDQHACEAFDVRAMDYLLKPVEPQRLSHSLDRIRERLKASRDFAEQNQVSRLIEELQPKSFLSRISVRTHRGLLLFKTDQIDLISSRGRYVMVRIGGESFRYREGIHILEQRLDPRHFLRIHRSMIVNLDRIARIETLHHGERRLTLRDGTQVTMSRKNARKLRSLM